MMITGGSRGSATERIGSASATVEPPRTNSEEKKSLKPSACSNSSVCEAPPRALARP